MRFLAPPDRARQPHRGADVFQRIGCADCHTPSMKTGPSSVKALAHKEVFLYSDLLLHALGPALAALCRGVAKPEEFRTAQSLVFACMPSCLPTSVGLWLHV